MRLEGLSKDIPGPFADKGDIFSLASRIEGACKEAVKSLSPEAMILYFIDSGVCALTERGLVRYVPLIYSEENIEKCQRYTASPKPPLKAWRTEFAKMAKCLFEPIIDIMRAARHIVVIATPPVHQIPIHGLPFEGAPLIAGRVVSYEDSLLMMLYRPQVEETPKEPKGLPIVVSGITGTHVPWSRRVKLSRYELAYDLTGSTKTPLKDLDGLEGRQVALRLGPCHHYHGTDATANIVQSLGHLDDFQNCPVFHVQSHFHFESLNLRRRLRLRLWLLLLMRFWLALWLRLVPKFRARLRWRIKKLLPLPNILDDSALLLSQGTGISLTYFKQLFPKGTQLLFLNCCCTSGQDELLGTHMTPRRVLTSDVKHIICTTASVLDASATVFADLFYRALDLPKLSCFGEGSPLRAYQAACLTAAVMTKEAERQAFNEISQSVPRGDAPSTAAAASQATPQTEDLVPWNFEEKKGAELRPPLYWCSYRFYCRAPSKFALPKAGDGERWKMLLQHGRESIGALPVQERQPVHHGVQCDQCFERPIVGCRHKCGVCENYDLCDTCYLQVAEGHPGHAFSHHQLPIEPVRHTFVDECENCQMEPIVGVLHRCPYCGMCLCNGCAEQLDTPTLTQLKTCKAKGDHCWKQYRKPITLDDLCFVDLAPSGLPTLLTRPQRLDRDAEAQAVAYAAAAPGGDIHAIQRFTDEVVTLRSSPSGLKMVETRSLPEPSERLVTQVERSLNAERSYRLSKHARQVLLIPDEDGAVRLIIVLSLESIMAFRPDFSLEWQRSDVPSAFLSMAFCQKHQLLFHSFFTCCGELEKINGRVWALDVTTGKDPVTLPFSCFPTVDDLQNLSDGVGALCFPSCEEDLLVWAHTGAAGHSEFGISLEFLNKSDLHFIPCEMPVDDIVELDSAGTMAAAAQHHVVVFNYHAERLQVFLVDDCWMGLSKVPAGAMPEGLLLSCEHCLRFLPLDELMDCVYRPGLT